MTDLERFLAQTTASGKIPGVSLAVLRAGLPGAQYHCGIRGAHDHTAVDAATVFEAASLTKPLVAFIALQLFEEKRLDPQQPLFDICGEYVPGDPDSRRITASHVLTHTSGLPNIVRDEAPLRTYFAPGERFSYGSSAFAWLQRAMETVSARSLESLARERVFEPLDMRHSSLAWQERFAGNHAQGHEWEGEPVPKRRVQTAHASWSLLTTASDYIGFVRHVLARGGLSAASYAQWFLPRIHTRRATTRKTSTAGTRPIPTLPGDWVGVSNPSRMASFIGETIRGSGLSFSPTVRRRMRSSGSPTLPEA